MDRPDSTVLNFMENPSGLKRVRANSEYSCPRSSIQKQAHEKLVLIAYPWVKVQNFQNPEL